MRCDDPIHPPLPFPKGPDTMSHVDTGSKETARWPTTTRARKRPRSAIKKPERTRRANDSACPYSRWPLRFFCRPRRRSARVRGRPLCSTEPRTTCGLQTHSRSRQPRPNRSWTERSVQGGIRTEGDLVPPTGFFAQYSICPTDAQRPARTVAMDRLPPKPLCLPRSSLDELPGRDILGRVQTLSALCCRTLRFPYPANFGKQ